jgi:hypothetical protein
VPNFTLDNSNGKCTGTESFGDQIDILDTYLGIYGADACAVYEIEGNINIDESGSCLSLSPEIYLNGLDARTIVWGKDNDVDGVPDISDNCPATYNPDQEEEENERVFESETFWPSVVDYDYIRANDGIGDVCDNCPLVSNADQANADADEVGDACDNCPGTTNQDQADVDRDGIGDACDACTDVDGDGYATEGGDCGDEDCNDSHDPSDFGGCSYSSCIECQCDGNDPEGPCREVCAQCARCMFPGAMDNLDDGWDSNGSCEGDEWGGVTTPGSDCDNDHNYCGTIVVKGPRTTESKVVNMLLYLLPVWMILIIRRWSKTNAKRLAMRP